MGRDSEYFTYIGSIFLPIINLDISEHQQQPNRTQPHPLFLPHLSLISPQFSQFPSNMDNYFLVFIPFVKYKMEISNKGDYQVILMHKNGREANRFVLLLMFTIIWATLVSFSVDFQKFIVQHCNGMENMPVKAGVLFKMLIKYDEIMFEISNL